MAEAAVITWTPANWLTVVLMVALAFVIIGAIARVIQQRNTASSGS